MITTQLPAGLTGLSAEMYSDNNTLMALTEGATIPVIKVSRLRNKVFRHMVNRPAIQKRMEDWVGSDIDAQINRYGQCLWGSFNNIPDVDEEGNMSTPEFIQCSMRSTCPHNGIICKPYEISTEVSLSRAEERILPYLLWADRIIAHILNVSPFTITTQIKSIKNKLNFQTKAELINWAKDNGILLCK